MSTAQARMGGIAEVLRKQLHVARHGRAGSQETYTITSRSGISAMLSTTSAAKPLRGGSTVMTSGRRSCAGASSFATSDASPQKNSAFLTPLRAAFSLRVVDGLENDLRTESHVCFA